MVSLEEFMNSTLAGKAGLPPYEPLTTDELNLFNVDFARLLNWLTDIDVEIARKFNEGKDYYAVAAGIFKKQMNMEFGGLEPSSGQFGIDIIPSYPILAANTWLKTIAGAGWQDFWGSAAAPINGSTTAGSQRGYYIQGLISMAAGCKISSLRVTVGGYTYPIVPYQLIARTSKVLKAMTYLPLTKNILCHCGGKFYIRASEEAVGSEEIVPLGLMFAEYKYLDTEASFYV